MAILPAVSSSATHGAVVPIAYANSVSGGVTFTNIPQNYQDLMVVMYARDTTSASNSPIYFQNFNGDNGASTYSNTFLLGNGSSASSSRTSSTTSMTAMQVPSASATSGIFGTAQIHILNYANASTYKTVLSRNAYDLNGSGGTILSVGLWRNTAALTSFSIYPQTAFATGTTVELFGIRTVGQ